MRSHKHEIQLLEEGRTQESGFPLTSLPTTGGEVQAGSHSTVGQRGELWSMGKSVTGLAVMVAGGQGWRRGVREEENNEESEETPNTTRQAVLRLDSPQYLPAQSSVDRSGGWEGRGEKRGRRRERERGSGGNKDVSVPFPGTWPEMGGGKVCVWDLA